MNLGKVERLHDKLNVGGEELEDVEEVSSLYLGGYTIH